MFIMKRRIIFSAIIIFCLCINNIRCGKSYNNTGSNPPPGGGGVTASVNITTGMVFSPSSLTVKTGTTVTWKNNDAVAHTATSDPGSAFTFDTGNISAGYSGSVVVTKTGTFTYHCNYHPVMTATLVVTP
jgi:plastocyanin